MTSMTYKILGRGTTQEWTQGGRTTPTLPADDS